ncbi:MAG: TonB-dependent receptor [Oceanospirillaceae bacterium]|nr:TonB-dependent receptor [Oceanospirillaceae bacterium]|tara:strand:+ start:25189 stop:28005 length:2817 start_codon:yes stop_codon:yes gene_type:complete
MKTRFTPTEMTLSALTLALLTSNAAFADGIINGRLTSAQGSAALNGLTIHIDELNRDALTADGGRFRFPQVKAGEYTLSVTQGGEVIGRETIQVTDNQTTSTTISIDDFGAREEILVVGQAAQIQRSLDRQRFADNTISAVDADAIGQLPDANAAEALQRIPGLSIERDQGEGRFVRVRGIGAELNSVTVNGAQIPAPEAGTRAVALDVIPSPLLSSLTVTKTLTPDMDANAIGGTIDIKSISALDQDGPFYTLSVEGSRDGQSSQNSPAMAVSGGNAFNLAGGQRFGVAAALSWDERRFGSDNVETGGAWDLEDGEDLLEEIEMREYSITRTRLGAALNLEYEVDANNRFYLNNLYSSFKDEEQRQAVVTAFYETVLDDEGEEDEEDIAIAPGTLSSGEVEHELKDREETQEILSTLFGGEHFINDWTVEYQLGLSKASEDQPDAISGAVFKGDFDDLSYRNTRKPVVYGPAGFYDAAEYELDEIEVEDSYAEDKQTMGKLDITRDLLIGERFAVIKGGIKLTRREKTQDVDVTLYDEFDDSLPDATMADFASAEVDYSLGRFGPGISKSAMRSSLAGLGAESINAEDSANASVLEDYSIDEDIRAAYLMGTFDVTDRIRVIAGVRHEATEVTSDGYAVTLSENDAGDEVTTVTAVSADKDYSHTLPALLTRFRLSDSTQLRASVTQSVVRPTFEQMRPNIEDDNGEAELGNPDLNPLEAVNLDLGVEHYMSSASVLSAFVFSKSIENFIYETELVGSPQYAAYDEVSTFRNGDTATLTGIELAASHKFTSLPSPFDGFLIGANATFTDSEATISAYDEGETLKRDIRLPSQSDTTGNLVLGYENTVFSVRVAANYKSEYLLEVGSIEDGESDLYADSQTMVDINSAWNVTDQLKVTFAVANLTDEPYYVYQKSNRYNAQYEDYGPTYRLGVRFSHF